MSGRCLIRRLRSYQSGPRKDLAMFRCGNLTNPLSVTTNDRKAVNQPWLLVSHYKK